MTELGITPAQTAGPYLRIGLLRNLIGSEVVDPGDPRAVVIRGRLTDGAGDGVGRAGRVCCRMTKEGHDVARGRQPATGIPRTTATTFPARKAFSASGAREQRTTGASRS